MVIQPNVTLKVKCKQAYYNCKHKNILTISGQINVKFVKINRTIVDHSKYIYRESSDRKLW